MNPPPGPSFRDWALFAIGVTFVAMSLFIASRDGLREALFPLCFFGVCALVSGYVVVRKLRRRRFPAIQNYRVNPEARRELVAKVALAAPT